MKKIKINIPYTVPRNKRKAYIKNWRVATKNTGRLMMFAGDQKVEHLNDNYFGPGIPDEVADPRHYFEIAKRANIGFFATQLGLLAKYGDICPKIPYIVKMNSKTNIIKRQHKDPFSNRWLPMEDIVNFKKNSRLNIVGVGYTVYIGSDFEAESFGQAARIIYKAHQEGLLAVIWIYPRGRAVKDEKDIHLLAGGTGVGVCLGADFVKINYPYKGATKETAKKFKEVVNAAGRTGVICVGGKKMTEKAFLQHLHNQIHISGTRGCAVGRNIYQRKLEEAVKMANAISAVALYDYSADDAYKIFTGKAELKVKKCSNISFKSPLSLF